MTSLDIRFQLLAQCEGLDCDPLHIPYVDVGIIRSSSPVDRITKTLALKTPTEPIKPVTSCTKQSDDKCNVFNCPWVAYQTGNDAQNVEKQCKYIHEAQRDTTHDDMLPVAPPLADEKPDKIFNITFNFAHGSSINNIKFQYPEVPLYHDPSLWGMKVCPDTNDVPVSGLKCTQVMTAEVGDLVELRLIGAESPTNEARRLMWTYHTVHIHGNDYYLTNMGFPETFANGSIAGINKNLECLNEACTKHKWNEAALEKEEIQGHFISKNTLLLPAQGYSIVRFRAENPGYWPLHCHNMMHNLEGMGMLFYIKDSVNNRPFSMIPEGLPQCANQTPSKRYPWVRNMDNSGHRLSISSSLFILAIYYYTL